MKNTLLSLVAIAALGVAGTLPAYASNDSHGGGFLCSLPFIGKLLCPPAPGGGGGNSSVPEPTSLAILAAGAGLVGAAVRRRRIVKK
jgi:PEP-CTERM motif